MRTPECAVHGCSEKAYRDLHTDLNGLDVTVPMCMGCAKEAQKVAEYSDSAISDTERLSESEVY